MDWVVAGIIVAIAAALAAQRSSYLVDYVLIVYVFNRGLRRVLDYHAGSFNPFSPVSLTPLIVTGLMLIPFLPRFGTLPKVHEDDFYCLFIAIGYAFIIGFIRIQFGAVYSLAEVLAPIAMFGYILTCHRLRIRRIVGCALQPGVQSGQLHMAGTNISPFHRGTRSG